MLPSNAFHFVSHNTIKSRHDIVTFVIARLGLYLCTRVIGGSGPHPTGIAAMGELRQSKATINLEVKKI